MTSAGLATIRAAEAKACVSVLRALERTFAFLCLARGQLVRDKCQL